MHVRVIRHNRHFTLFQFTVRNEIQHASKLRIANQTGTSVILYTIFKKEKDTDMKKFVWDFKNNKHALSIAIWQHRTFRSNESTILNKTNYTKNRPYLD